MTRKSHSAAARRAPVRRGDLWALAGYAAFATTLLAPLRHYVGDLKKVTEAKIEKDSFPLSTYPMFSADRKGRIVIPHVVGFTAQGERVIPHYSHFGSGGLNQVRKQIARGIRQGQAVQIAQQYADSLAKQQSRATTPTKPEVQQRHEREAAIVTVAVVRARYIFDDYFADNKLPAAETIHAECPIGGAAFAHPASKLPKHRPTKAEPERTRRPRHSAVSVASTTTASGRTGTPGRGQDHASMPENTQKAQR